MSLLLRINLGRISLLASDSLHVWNNVDGTNTINDAVEKIVRTPRGLAAGIGSINVFKPVLDEIAANGFADSSEVTAQLRASFNDFLKHPGPAANVRKGRTAIVATYSDTDLHLKSFHQDDNFEAENIVVQILPLLPAGSTPGKYVVQNALLVGAVSTGDWHILIPALAGYCRACAGGVRWHPGSRAGGRPRSNACSRFCPIRTQRRWKGSLHLQPAWE